MEITLQSLIDAAQSAPEGATPVDAVAALLADNAADVDVAALQAEAVARFDELSEAGVDSDEALAAVEALADVVDGTRAEQARLDEANAAKQDRIAELARRVNPPADDSDNDGVADSGEGQDAESTPAAGEPHADTTPSEPAAAPTVEAVAPEPVAAAASPVKPRPRVNLAKLPRKEPAVAPRRGPVITAAAEVNGYSAGQRINGTTDLARAANAKFGSMPAGHVPDAHISARVASIHVPFPKELVADGRNDQEVIDYAADPSRLDGQSLVAAGGWCAPSETLYDLGSIIADANAGLIDVPEVQATRGGLRFTEGPDYSTIWSNTGFIQTEAQAIAGSGFTTVTGGTTAGTEKPFYRVPCPSFTEQRAEAVGAGIVAGILQNDAYPELTADVVEHALIAHSHRVNARTINRMVTEAGSAITVNLGPSATASVLNTLDAQITDYRYLNRMAETAELEVVLPAWLKAVIRSDQAVRNGSDTTEAYSVTDQKINAWFAARSARVQWVYDWQDAYTGVSGGFGSAAAITSWPDTVDALVYAAGTFVRARGEVITLDAIYDSTNIKVNDFHRLFVEEKLLVIKRRWKARLVTIALAANGATGSARDLDADGKIVAGP